MKPIILVTGANGQVGRELRICADKYTDYHFIFFSREELPIHDARKAEEIFSRYNPQFCINCAAYTAVDKAETDQELAFSINGEAAGVLAALCHTHNVKFIHISTDYVFNGKGTAPYREDDPVEPVNAYGASKLKGEELALQYNPGSVIIRTSWVYSEFGNNFVKTMMRLMRERDSLNVVNDQLGSPTYAADLASAMMSIIRSGQWVPGIYHYSNGGVITWYQFAGAIKSLISSPCTVNPVGSEGFPTPAKRPGYSVMNTSKIKATFQLDIPAWKESLEVCVQRLMP